MRLMRMRMGTAGARRVDPRRRTVPDKGIPHMPLHGARLRARARADVARYPACVYQAFGARAVRPPPSLPFPSLSFPFLCFPLLSCALLLGFFDERELIGSRIKRLEMLDEVEELDLVLEHYAITWGVKIPDGRTDEDKGWESWGLRLKGRQREREGEEESEGEKTETETD